MNVMPSCIKEIERRARKDHTCCECNDVISKGSKYLYISGIWDGKASDFKQCSKCRKLISAALSLSDDFGFDYDEGPPLGGFFNWVNEWEDSGGGGMKKALGICA